MSALIRFPSRGAPRASFAAPSSEFLAALGTAKSKAGQDVSAETAMRCAAVYACVRVLAESVAQLPLLLYRRTKGGGKARAFDHPLYPILRDRPNQWQTSFEYRELQQANLAMRGNAYAYINRVGGRVVELLPIRNDRVTPEQLDDFTVRYHVKRSSGSSDTFASTDIHHLRGLSTNGLTGLSPITQAREAIGLALATEEHGALLFANGAQPGGILEHPTRLSPEAAKRLKDSWESAHGAGNRHRTAVLEEGVKWHQLGMTSEDAQFLETRKYQRSEIASLFRVPPHMIGDLERATFSNIEQQSIEFVVHTMMPWLRRWEQAITRDLLTPKEQEQGFFAEFLVDGLLRGDIKSRFDAYAVAVTNGWMNRNEVRLRENMNPAPGLDAFLTPLNMTAGPAADSPTPTSEPDADA